MRKTEPTRTKVSAEVRRIIEQLSTDNPYAQSFDQAITPIPQKDISIRIEGLSQKVEIFSEGLRAVLQIVSESRDSAVVTFLRPGCLGKSHSHLYEPGRMFAGCSHLMWKSTRLNL